MVIRKTTLSEVKKQLLTLSSMSYFASNNITAQHVQQNCVTDLKQVLQKIQDLLEKK